MFYSNWSLEDSGNNRHEDEPEPHEDVDLLVEDVDRQHAEAVVVLQRPFQLLERDRCSFYLPLRIFLQDLIFGIVCAQS